MRQLAPLISLAMGLISYSLLLLVSQDASLNSLVIMGVISLSIIAISLLLVWQLIVAPTCDPSSPPAAIPQAKETLGDEYLEITDD